MAETRQQEAIEASTAVFEDRPGSTLPGGETFVSSAGVEEARVMAEISGRYSVPLMTRAGSGAGGSSP